jgi:hypothetical protein
MILGRRQSLNRRQQCGSFAGYGDRCALPESTFLALDGAALLAHSLPMNGLDHICGICPEIIR